MPICRLLFSVVFLMAAGGLAVAEEQPGYPLASPPLAALRADSADTMVRLGEAPVMQVAQMTGAARGWHDVEGFGALPLAQVVGAMEALDARDIALYFLPPITPPTHALLAMTCKDAPTDAEGVAALLRRLGARDLAAVPHEAFAEAGVFAFRFTGAATGGETARKGLLLGWSRGSRVYLTSDPEAAASSIGPRPATPSPSIWRYALEGPIAGAEDAVGCWVNLPFLVSGLERVDALGSARAQLSLAVDGLHAAAIPIPQALTLSLTPRAKSLALAADLPLTRMHVSRNAEASATPLLAIHPGDALPAEAQLRVDWQRTAVTPEGMRHDLFGDRSAWEALLAFGAIADSRTTGITEARLNALRLLTGFHPGRDLLDTFGDRAAFAMWPERGRTSWCFIAEMPASGAGGLAEPLLQRALAWGSFFAAEAGAPLESTRSRNGTNPDLWSGTAHSEDLGVRLAWQRSEQHFILAREEKTVAQVAEALGTLTPRPVGPDWFHWRSHLPLARRSDFAGKVVQTLIKPPKEGDTFGDSAERVALQGVMLRLLSSETGSFGPTRTGLGLRAEGVTPPLAFGASIAMAVRSVVGETPRHRTENAVVTASMLRTLMEMQQVFRHMGLGEFNGQPPGRHFAPSLGVLVTGRNEAGRSLLPLWEKQYPSAEDDPYPFTAILAGIARGASAYGYRYQCCDPQDAHWALFAVPQYFRDPALAMDATGALWWKIPRRGAALTLKWTDDPGRAGWQRWE